MENIEVSVRVRPLNSKEVTNSSENVWKIENTGKTITLLASKTLPSPT
jgi:hypothetical protein